VAERERELGDRTGTASAAGRPQHAMKREKRGRRAAERRGMTADGDRTGRGLVTAQGSRCRSGLVHGRVARAPREGRRWSGRRPAARQCLDDEPWMIKKKEE